MLQLISQFLSLGADPHVEPNRTTDCVEPWQFTTTYDN
jgi:hypothetical protein